MSIAELPVTSMGGKTEPNMLQHFSFVGQRRNSHLLLGHHSVSDSSKERLRNGSGLCFSRKGRDKLFWVEIAAAEIHLIPVQTDTSNTKILNWKTSVLIRSVMKRIVILSPRGRVGGWAYSVCVTLVWFKYDSCCPEQGVPLISILCLFKQDCL